MNKRFKRLSALLLALWLMSSFALPAVQGSEEPEAVTISTAEDLHRLAKSCALDTWSQGKTVILTADLDLAGEEFAPIPTFGGAFLGRGHIISGLRVTSAGSTQGLFRYIQPGGTVQDLTVKGTVIPEGTRSVVGGIVGDNAGTLQNCSFQGVVQGGSVVGGVAGRNSESGQIIGCTAAGSVSGGSATGGVAGRNLGLLLKCENSAGVNLTQAERELDLLNMDAGAALEERAAADDETYHLLSSCSDTGGIVGCSSGVVQSCTNRGAVGYPHVGYNTGGIAGRQSGYLAGCVNTGVIHGRKDVGGVVGQAEPYVVADLEPDTLDRLRRELDTLERLINRALDDTRRAGDGVSARLEAMGVYADDARDSSQRLLDRISAFTDENIGSVNTVSADITNALDKISPALDDLSEAGGQLENLSRRLGDALDALEGAVDTGGRTLDGVRAALDGLRQSQKGLSTAADRLKQALDGLYQAAFPEGPGGLPVRPDPDALEESRASLREAFNALRDAGDGAESALSRLERALLEAQPLSGALKDVLDELQGASGSSAAIGRLLRRAFDAIGGAVDDLTRDGPAEFIPLGDGFHQDSGGLFDALGGLSGEMAELNGVLQKENHTLTADLRSVSRQFNVVFDVLLDALAGLRDGSEKGLDGLLQDTSEEDIAATREGKVTDCRNTGAVEGDRNVGGVIGAMAIEFDLDPEDDAADLFSFGATYETKAVLQNCLNYGSVTAKKDCVGGVAGRMDLGTALDCQNYGPAASTGGDYVGGVAGFADASVRGCSAKSTLSGGNYVGGIAGWASGLRDCYAIATITEGSECLGAVAGGVETGGVLRNNRFVDTGTAGVDGVSYAGRAEPIPFDELSRLPDVPLELTAFTLTLLAGGETVARIPFLYGEDLSRVQLPLVPELEGNYGVWPEFDVSGVRSDVTVEAVYAPWVTVIASQERSGKLSLALAEGRFTEAVTLHVTDSTQPPPFGAEPDAVVWEVSLTGSELGAEDDLPLRLLSSSGGDAEVWQYDGGEWRQVSNIRNGQYLMLTMTGTRGIFCILPQAGIQWMPLAAGVGGGAVLLLLLSLAGRGRKKKKAARTAGTPEEQAAAAKS